MAGFKIISAPFTFSQRVGNLSSKHINVAIFIPFIFYDFNIIFTSCIENNQVSFPKWKQVLFWIEYE
jgi:hypothetical protein